MSRKKTIVASCCHSQFCGNGFKIETKSCHRWVHIRGKFYALAHINESSSSSVEELEPATSANPTATINGCVQMDSGLLTNSKKPQVHPARANAVSTVSSPNMSKTPNLAKYVHLSIKRSVALPSCHPNCKECVNYIFSRHGSFLLFSQYRCDFRANIVNPMGFDVLFCSIKISQHRRNDN